MLLGLNLFAEAREKGIRTKLCLFTVCGPQEFDHNFLTKRGIEYVRKPVTIHDLAKRLNGFTEII